MREAIGNGMLLNVVIVIVAAVMLFFAGIFSYSKAYRIKNRIVEIIEEYGEYNSTAESAISTDLKTAGYFNAKNKSCSSDNVNSTTYNYCIYKIINSDENNSYYYKVVTYTQFNFPFIGDFIKIPVKGETRILGKEYFD